MDHRLHHFRALLAYKPTELADNRPLGGVMTKHQPRDRDDNDQQRTDGERGIKGDRCAASEVLVFDETGYGALDLKPGPGNNAGLPDSS